MPDERFACDLCLPRRGFCPGGHLRGSPTPERRFCSSRALLVMELLQNQVYCSSPTILAGDTKVRAGQLTDVLFDDLLLMASQVGLSLLDVLCSNPAACRWCCAC